MATTRDDHCPQCGQSSYKDYTCTDCFPGEGPPICYMGGCENELSGGNYVIASVDGRMRAVCPPCFDDLCELRLIATYE